MSLSLSLLLSVWNCSGGSFYVFGGERQANVFNDVWKFNMASSVWSYPRPAVPANGPPRARYGHTLTAMDDDCFVLFGGECCDLLLKCWSKQKADYIA